MEKIEDGIEVVEVPETSNPSTPSLVVNPPIEHHHTRTLSNISTSSSDTDGTASRAPSSYATYLEDAKGRVAASYEACSKWTWRYDGFDPSPSGALDLLDVARNVTPVPYPKPQVLSDHADFVHSENLNLSHSKNRTSSLSFNRDKGDKEGIRISRNASCSAQRTVKNGDHSHSTSADDDNNLDSLGESSGYESFNIKMSRETSPTHSVNGTPRNQISNPGSPVADYIRKSVLNGSLKRHRSSSKVSEDLTEFIEILEGMETPPEDNLLEESIKEIELAFKENAVLDPHNVNQVRLLKFHYMKFEFLNI